MASFGLQAVVAAPVDVVFEVLTDHRGYANITPLRSSTLEREGHPDRNGVGAIRVLSLLGPSVREEVTEFERPTRFSYKLLSGAPVKSHGATVELSARGDQTELVWRVESTPRLPVPDAVWTAFIRLFINQLLEGVVSESERRAGSG